MVFGIGTDIVEISRVKKIMERTPLFLEKVYTSGEREYCLNKRQSGQSFATRFAAKEAVFKAFGTGLAAFSWHDVEVVSLENGRPAINLSGELQKYAAKINVESVKISLSHSGDSALAFAVVIVKED